MEHHAEVLSGGVWQQRIPGWRDAVAMLLLLGIVLLLGLGAREMVGPFVPAQQVPISLSPAALPLYTLGTVMRMLAALVASLVFTFTYATLAAKSRRAEKVLIPVLDVLQSVPILGYLSFTVLFFVSLFPGNILGPELAAIFAIFTSQAWNMAFSFYQSLKTVPADLDEVSRSFRETAWQRFWRLEVPFAMPGLVWNMMMSMSGGWFFVVAAEAISVGDLKIALPGVGSYVARAIEERDLAAVGWAILAMAVAILLYDQLLFRPMVAWADKFRFEQTAAQVVPRSWVLDLFRRSPLLNRAVAPIAAVMRKGVRMRFSVAWSRKGGKRVSFTGPLINVVWYALLLYFGSYMVYRIIGIVGSALSLHDVRIAAANGFLTLLRVAILIAIASAIWVPVGVGIGLHPVLTERVQPIAQFLAAFPANLFFPIAVYSIIEFHLTPGIWLSPLMILGAQWYILFNVIAGASAFPSDLREAAASFRIRRWRWWRDVMLPGIFPYYVTGAITAAGGAWNASIVSEAVSWGPIKLSASGLGAYIAQMTEAGDYPRIALGVIVMSILVTATNKLLWRPLYVMAERRSRLG
ncbi:ABC transporter permease subunit [Pseudaminobacter soli (ex Zhang et al. 2022)]